MTQDTKQFNRRFSLLVVKGNKVLDLSNMHCKFKCSQADFESPNNANVRVYNLSDKTLEAVQEFDQVVIQAGYGSNFGVIFKGTIKQFGVGKENAKDTYLDIFAADGEEDYNFAVTNVSIDKATPEQVRDAAIKSMVFNGLYLGYQPGDSGVTLPRGRVKFGMARDVLRQYAQSRKCSWSIQNGEIQIIPLDSYRPGEAAYISFATGLVGRAEQRQNGIEFKHLLNPLFTVGYACKIDNKSINQIAQVVRNQPGAAPIPYNQRVGVQELAKTTSDGLYRMLVVDHEGDTRGQAWYSYVTALAIDTTTNKVKPYG